MRRREKLTEKVGRREIYPLVPLLGFLQIVLVKVAYYASSTALFWPNYAKIMLPFF